MFYTVYRTTNLVNGKRYYGCHKTNDPQDDYLGSGVILLRAIEKYGRENFVKDVLAIFSCEEVDREAAFALEREIVDRELGLPGCYNLKRGGEGGYDFINSQGLSGASQGGKVAYPLLKKFLDDNPEVRARTQEAWREGSIRWMTSPEGLLLAQQHAERGTETWRGQKHGARFKFQQSRRMVGNTLRKGIAHQYPLGASSLLEYALCGFCKRTFAKKRKGQTFCSRDCAAGKLTRPSVTELFQLLSEGDYRQVGKNLGLSPMTVHAWAKDYGIKRDRKGTCRLEV